MLQNVKGKTRWILLQAHYSLIKQMQSLISLILTPQLIRNIKLTLKSHL